METKPQYTQPIEEPMIMSYRESYAWQLGYDTGWKQAKQEFVKYLKDEYKEQFKGEKQ